MAKMAPVNIDSEINKLRSAELFKAMRLAAEKYDAALSELDEERLINVFIETCRGLQREDIDHEIRTQTLLGARCRSDAVYRAIDICVLRIVRYPQSS